MDSPAHLLSLKVMRVSRPEVQSAWQPFFSSSPFFSAHSSASLLSLQGNAPLPGHPKTLRDLTHASELLTLPASFGSIQLGQTFSSCLSINNEATFSVDSIRIRVEMQTVTSKIILYHTPEPTGRTLPPTDTLEALVNHEIKELGQHVLACAVTYRAPPNVRPVPGASEHPNDPGLQTFRKFYKFVVTNPLAVKTKVHPIRSPTALLIPHEREKIFLEVHLQNVTQETMHFERMAFEPTDDWQVQDPNFLDSGQSVFSASLALMNPQDVRQYVFILTPTFTTDSRPLAVPAPGNIFPLGRLNIAWRSAYGEPGRLLTSMLTRRIPLVTPNPPPAPPQSQQQQPVSAVPPYLKRERDRSSSQSSPSRPQSPTPSPSQPQSRPQSPQASIYPNHRNVHSVHNLTITPSHQHQPIPNIDAHLTLMTPLPSSFKLEIPFTLTFTLHITTIIPSSAGRRFRFAIQHILPPSSAIYRSTNTNMVNEDKSQNPNQTGTRTGHNTPRAILSPTLTTGTSLASSLTHQISEALSSPRASLSVLSSGFSTPTAASSRAGGTGSNANSASTGGGGGFNYALARQKLLVASPRQTVDFYDEGDGENQGGYEERDLNKDVNGIGEGEIDGVIYPSPYPITTQNQNQDGNGNGEKVGKTIIPLGASAFSLPILTLEKKVIPSYPSSTSTSGPSGSTSAPVTTTAASNTIVGSTQSSDSSSEDSQDSDQIIGEGDEKGEETHAYASTDFELTYFPLQPGYGTIGGLRILYIDEDFTTQEESNTNEANISAATFVPGTGHEGLIIGNRIGGGVGGRKKAQILKEYEVLAEIWVSS